MNYNIIRDEALMKDFISSLPELEKHETYYVSLLARKKWNEKDHKVSDKIGIKAFSATKDRMFDKIKQLECPLGSYKDYKYDIDVAEELIGLYIYLNPRNIKMANAEFATMTVKNGFSNDENLKRRNPIVWSKTYLAQAKSKTRFVGFDFDMTEDYTKEDWMNRSLPIIKTLINEDAFYAIETRGGFHLIVEVDKVNPKFKNTWHRGLVKKVSDIDITGDMMSPIPGGIQGGFVPRLIKR